MHPILLRCLKFMPNEALREASMFRTALFVVLSLGFAVVPGLAAPRNVPLAAGTLIRCVVDEPNFSPRTARVGDPVVCYARPLVEFGCSAFPPGTQLGGSLVAYRKPGRFIGKGWMKLEFDRLILPVGEAGVRARVISVNGFKVDRQGRIRGHGHPKRDAAGWMIPVLWPIKVITLPMRGPEPALRGERVITLRVLDDITVPCEGFGYGLTGSLWNPFTTSSRLIPFGTPRLQPFDANEKTAARVFASWKGKSVSGDAAASVRVLNGVSADPPSVVAASSSSESRRQ
jgi:hypothetical protein